MRIRRKKWAKQELEEAAFYVDNPEICKNAWHEKFAKNQPLHIELGCGKGNFIANLAVKHPEINYIAVDMIEAMLGLAKRNWMFLAKKIQWIEFTLIFAILGHAESTIKGV